MRKLCNKNMIFIITITSITLTIINFILTLGLTSSSASTLLWLPPQIESETIEFKDDTVVRTDIKTSGLPQEDIKRIPVLADNILGNNRRPSQENTDERHPTNINIINAQLAVPYVVVTGMEHSGTTALSELIMNAPGLGGAIESGFLLSENKPADFVNVHPWYDWILEGKKQMLQLSKEQTIELVSQPSFEEMYIFAMQHSPTLIHTNTTAYVDKTPRYVYHLPEIMEKLPWDVKVVILKKSFDDQKKSFLKRGTAIKDFRKRWDQAEQSITEAIKIYGHDCFYLQDYFKLFEDNNKNEAATNLFQWLNLTFDPSYFTGKPLQDKGYICTKLCNSKYVEEGMEQPLLPN